MTTPTTAELLKYADLQMAAEAFLVDTQSKPLTGDLYIQSLIDGNGHSSKFTDPQATNFAEHWIVLDQRANTSTGFSGTLFKCILSDPATGAQRDELVMSFRSTEFIDDSARDNQATNAMEIKETGFAWGQLRDMEAWYDELKNDPAKLGSKTFSVTGYSLGGHLATAFNVMHGTQGDNDPIDKVVTFNGAGIGAIDIRSYLKNLVDTFSTLAANADGQAFAFEDGALAALYGRARLAYQSGASISAADRAILYRLAGSPADSGRSGKAIATKSIAACARGARAGGRFDAQNRVFRALAPARRRLA
jgi:pimeloyl-ACP methyl ester carboxylesterase